MTSLFETPHAVERLGEALFLKLPVYASARPYTPIYIHPGLYDELFTPGQSWQKKAQTLSELFSVTLDPVAPSAKQAGWAYVDYQADPHWRSMAGNLGSGRAYYAGKYFNIKGEKTPLAISPRKRFADGFLEMERGIWEAVVSNTLADECSVGIANILAILDLHETCEVEWRTHAVPRVKIIRIDRDGALDRLSHFLHAASLSAAPDLQHTAKQFGKLEAEKFAHRITHGAWSPGNISLQGHLIDFDTVAAVKGRHAQHSSSPAYIENYFGYEWMGQQKLLEMLAADPRLNAQNIPAPALISTMLSARVQHISERLAYLMGFENHAEVWLEYRTAFDALTEQFLQLAPLAYPKKDALFCKDGVSNTIHGFDIACFMRHYLLLKHSGQFTVSRALAMMTDITLVEAPFSETTPAHMSEAERQHVEQSVYQTLDGTLLRSHEDFNRWTEFARGFIVAYDALFEDIQKEFQPDVNALEARAYVLNEDRFYFLPAFTPTYHLSCQASNLTPQQMDERIQGLIFASTRMPVRDESGFLHTDVRLYREGMFYWQMDGAGGCRPVFQFHGDGLAASAKIPPGKACCFTIDGFEIPAIAVLQKPNKLVIQGEMQPTSHLLAQAYREKPLMFYEILIKWDNTCLTLTDFLEIPADGAVFPDRE